MTDHISDLRWDRLLAGELADDTRREVLAHAATCERCAARHREIEALATVPLPPLAVPRRSRWWLAAPISALAAAAVAMIVLRTPGDDDGARTKGGGTALLLSAGQPGALAPLADGDTVHAGDYVQAGYSAARDGFGAVLSRDGAGTASVYVPGTGDAMVPLPAGTERSFPSSTLLDAVTGTERIALIWCATPAPLAPLVAELRATDHLADRAGCTIRVVTLTKVAR